MAMHKPRDLVWAKMKGYPEWPAMVLAPSDVPMSCPSGKHPVKFFGTMETGFMRPAELFSYTKYRDKFEKPRRMKGFTQAVLEIRREAGIEEDLSDRFNSPQSGSSSKKKRKPTPSTAETPSTSTAKLPEADAEVPDDLTPTPIPQLSFDVDETPAPAEELIPAKSESPAPTPVKELPAPQLVTSSGRKRKPKIFQDYIQFDLAPRKVAVTPQKPKQASTPVAVPKGPPVTATPDAPTSNSAPEKSRKSSSSSSKKSKKETRGTPKLRGGEAERKEEERSERTLEESEASRNSVSPTDTELPMPEDAQNAVPAVVPDAVVHESEQLPEPEEPEATPPAREATPEPEPASHLVPYSDSESSLEEEGGLRGKNLVRNEDMKASLARLEESRLQKKKKKKELAQQVQLLSQKVVAARKTLTDRQMKKEALKQKLEFEKASNETVGKQLEACERMMVRLRETSIGILKSYRRWKHHQLALADADREFQCVLARNCAIQEQVASSRTQLAQEFNNHLEAMKRKSEKFRQKILDDSSELEKTIELLNQEKAQLCSLISKRCSVKRDRMAECEQSTSSNKQMEAKIESQKQTIVNSVC